jgi:hypothetical protein
MKNIFFFVVLFCMTSLFAQKKNIQTPILASWEQFEQLEKNGLYKNALQLLTPLLDQAIKENNVGDFQRALNEYIFTTENALLEEDEKLLLLNQLERKIDQTKVPLNNLGHLFLAHLYEQYGYQWGLYDEFKITINKTTLTNRTQAIHYHYQKALIHFEELMHYPAKEIHTLSYQSDSLINIFKPTLLDYGITEIENQFQNRNYNDTTLFYQTENLLNYPKDTLLSLYYQLENFHWKNNNHYAYVETVFQRINYINAWTNTTSKNDVENPFHSKRGTPHPIARKDINYAWLFEKLKKSPAAMKVQLKEAMKLNELGETYDWKTNSAVKNKKEEAVKLIEKSCSSYPNSLYYHEAQELLFDIKNTSLEAKIEGKTLPNTSNLLSVTYKNIDSIYLTIYHIEKIINDTSKNFFKDFKLKPLYKETLQLNKNGLYNKHTKDFILPAWKQTGKFLVLISENEKTEQSLTTEDSIDSHLKFSHLTIDVHEHTAIYKSENGNGILHVHDITSGKPLAKTKVIVKTGYNQSKKVTHYTTDKNGECNFPLNDNQANWTVNYKNDSIESSIYGYGQPEEDKDEIHFQILTDRAIYRPGQTVYYKIYAYKIQNHIKSVVKNEKLNIIIEDVNNKELFISENEFSTNEFGTYSSSFTLPKSGFSLGQISILVSDKEDDYDGETYIQVEEYKRPTFYIENKFTKNEYQLGESITFKGKVMSYADYPITNANVKIAINSSSYHWRENQSPFHKDTVLKTNAKGEYSYTFLLPSNSKYGMNLNIKSIVTNQTGETQENEIGKFIGNKKNEWSVCVPNEILSSENNIIHFNLTDSVKVNIPFQLVLLRENNNRNEIIQTFDEQEFQGFKQLEFNKLLPNCSYYQSQIKPAFDTLLTEKLYTNDSISIQKLTNNIPGFYKLTYYFINNQNDTIIETKEIKSIDITNEDKQHNEALWIKPYLQFPTIGQIVPILIGTKFNNQIVHYRIYRDNHLIEQKTIKIDKRKTIYYTIKKVDIDGISLEVYLVKQGDFHTRNCSIDISQQTKQIKLKIETKRSFLSPGQKEKWVISQQSTLNNDKELAVTMTDASLDKINPSNWKFKRNKYDRIEFNQWSYYNLQLDQYHDNLYSWNNWKNEIFSYTFINKETKGYFKKIKQYEIPLINKDGGVMSKMSIRESKSDDSNYFIDGIKVRGSSNLPKSALETVTIINGGTPATYGDNSGSVTSIKPSLPRTNFNETAFFYPNLYADKEGKFSFEFTLPDALTTWKFRALAHDKEMNKGQLTEYFIAQKELMVQPNAPRFLRAGDTIEFTATIVNITEKNVPIDASLEWFNPFTNEVIPDVFGKLDVQKIILTGKQSKTVSWRLAIPEKDLDLVAYHIKASSELFTDSEEKALPILSNRVLVTEALPITIEEKGNYTFELDKLSKSTSTTQQHQNVVFDFTSNPVWSAVKSLPSASTTTYQSADALFNAYYINALGSKILTSNPSIKQVIANWNVSSSELTKQPSLNTVDLTETPWVNAAQSESEQRKEIAFFLNENNLLNQQKNYHDQLYRQRNADGGWSWFAGGISNPYITTDIVFGMAQLNEGVSELTQSINFLNEYFNTTYNTQKRNGSINDNWISANEIKWLYIQATYYISNNELISHLNKCLNNSWTKLSLKQQALAGMYLLKAGNTTFAAKIAASIQNRATKRKNTGTYWNEKYYSNSEAIETQAYILQFFASLKSETSLMSSIQLSLLNQKRGQLWENSATTATVINAFLSVPSIPIQTKVSANIRIANIPLSGSTNELGDITHVWTKSEITPKLGKVEITQNENNPSFGSLTYAYTENIQKVNNSTTGLTIEKEIYLIKGEQEILVSPKTNLKVGDQLRIRLKVTSDRALDFVHIKDLKASGMENVNQLSSYGYGKNVSYYTTPYDNRTSFFIENLPKGKSSVSYDVRLTHKGTQSIGYALVECLYAPEFRGNTSGTKIVVE